MLQLKCFAVVCFFSEPPCGDSKSHSTPWSCVASRSPSPPGNPCTRWRCSPLYCGVSVLRAECRQRHLVAVNSEAWQNPPTSATITTHTYFTRFDDFIRQGENRPRHNLQCICAHEFQTYEQIVELNKTVIHQCWDKYYTFKKIFLTLIWQWHMFSSCEESLQQILLLRATAEIFTLWCW